jgi:arsenate reductase
MRRLSFAACTALLWAAPAAPAGPPNADPGPLVRALWLVHRHGPAEVVAPRNDVRTKSVLSKALGKDGTLTPTGAKALMDPNTFAKLAGPDGRLDPEETRRALDAEEPVSRRRLLPAVRAHAELLTTSFDMIDPPHREAGEELVDWVVENYRPGRPLHVTVVCTGNSRRSILGATMGNVAADYYGLPEVRFHSGGTAPTAFNPRTVAALRSIGLVVEPVGKEAPRGEPGTASGPAPEAVEFSKHYADPSNPQSGFAALMVCSEADAGCPVVKGAALRVSMPYLDPKIYDGSAFEAAKYAERRDDIGRLMLAVMMQARNRLAAGESHQQRTEVPR